MKVYETLAEAYSETRRDVKKSPVFTSLGVQQRTDEEIVVQELLGHTYSILPAGIPRLREDLVEIGVDFNLPVYVDHAEQLDKWMKWEFLARTGKQLPFPDSGAVENLHPALSTTIEGSWPSYTYHERLHGAVDILVDTLRHNPTGRRALWSLWRTEDSLRAMYPTRVPCSVYYQFFIRKNGYGIDQLDMVYNMRSSDLDTFFLTDVWLADAFRRELSNRLNVQPGNFIHMITSLHSFTLNDKEIY